MTSTQKKFELKEHRFLKLIRLLNDIAKPILQKEVANLWKIETGLDWDEATISSVEFQDFVSDRKKGFAFAPWQRKPPFNLDFQYLFCLLKSLEKPKGKFSEGVYKPLKELRNKLAHINCTSEISDDVFNEIWTEVSKALVSRNGCEAEIEALKNCTFQMTNEENDLKAQIFQKSAEKLSDAGNYLEAIRAYSEGLTLQNLSPVIEFKLYIGVITASLRLNKNSVDENVTAKLKEKWFPVERKLVKAFYPRISTENTTYAEIVRKILKEGKEDGFQHHKVVICGNGGGGKTTLATWVCIDSTTEYDHIIWIDCVDKSTIFESFNMLAMTLDVKNWKELRTLKYLAMKCYEKLGSVKCLIVFDNAHEYSGANGIKDILPQSEIDNLYCLITSRNTQWGKKEGMGLIKPVGLNLFDVDESVTFLRIHHKGPRSSDEKYAQLANSLGNLPLSLQIALGTLNTTFDSVEKYLKMIEKTNSLINSPMDLDDYELSINKSMSISIDLIQNLADGEIAYNIAKTFGYLSTVVKAKFFEDTLCYSPEEVEYAIEMLMKHSLITFFPTLRQTYTFNYDKPAKKSLMAKSMVQEDVDVSTGAEDTRICPSVDHEIHVEKVLVMNKVIQQVLRYKTRQTEKQILTKILNSKGEAVFKLYIYKYISKYEDLNEVYENCAFQSYNFVFNLFSNERFDEAAKLCEVRNNGEESDKNKYNYALCLASSQCHREALEIILSISTFEEEPKDDICVRLTLLEEGKLPSKYAVAILFCSVYLRLGEQINEDFDRMLNTINSLDKITLTDLGYPVNLCVLRNIKSIKLDFTNVYYDNQTIYWENLTEWATVDKFELNDVGFVSHTGKMFKYVSFHNLGISFFMKELIINCKTRSCIAIDFSKLHLSLTKAKLSRVVLCSSKKEYTSKISDLTLIDLRYTTTLKNILPKCKFLIHLKMEDLHFEIDLRLIPMSVKKISFRHIYINDEHSSVELDKLTLHDCLTFDEIVNFKLSFTSIDHLSLVFDDGVFPRNLVSQDDRQKQWIRLINDSNKFSIGGILLGCVDFKSLGLDQYGIQTNSNYYFISKAKIGKTLSVDEFFDNPDYVAAHNLHSLTNMFGNVLNKPQQLVYNIFM